MSKEALKALNRKRGAVKAQLTRIKNFMNNPDEKDKTHLESKLDTLKSLRIKLRDIRDEYYEVVADDILREIENCPDFEIPTMSREEKLCEEHFTSTYNRDETVRFIVKMPLSRDPSCLGDSKQMALRSLIHCGED
ncbi:hypothetical protein TNCV_1915461 [Trichonephila clavipes]|uniref:Uncharacterized protein n=1 Tax=Trichonephila clavipes TaxID=2585209 RepID=A0A8X6W0V7_TRICX|nr:hypothetical protein TNCV_1915461 [Trichonephila clavipes]